MSREGWERRYVLAGAVPPVAAFLVPNVLFLLGWLLDAIGGEGEGLVQLGAGMAVAGVLFGIWAYGLFLLGGAAYAATRKGERGVLMFILGAVAIAGALCFLLFGTCSYLAAQTGARFL